MITVSVMLFVYINKDRSNVMTVSFLDVGQGDAIFIETPTGGQLLIDAGINAKVLESLDDALPFFDRAIDTILMTHPDADHIGGFPDVLGSYSVRNAIQGIVFEDNPISLEIKERLKEGGLVHIVEAKDKIILDNKYNIYLEILHPSEMFTEVDKNDASIIARLVYGDIEIMLTGDASIKIENYLVGTVGERLQSDVLKVGHHGSKTSTDESFLGFVNPTYGIISVGEDNKFGHPHSEVIEKLNSFNVEILETKTLGTIVMKTDGKELWLEK